MLGKHWIIEVYDADPRVLDNRDTLEEMLCEVTRVYDVQILHSHFHNFQPQGITGIVMIAESHLTIHTWPEFGYAGLDFFTCGKKTDTEQLSEILKKFLRTQNVILWAEHERGVGIT